MMEDINFRQRKCIPTSKFLKFENIIQRGLLIDILIVLIIHCLTLAFWTLNNKRVSLNGKGFHELSMCLQDRDTWTRARDNH